MVLYINIYLPHTWDPKINTFGIPMKGKGSRVKRRCVLTGANRVKLKGEENKGGKGGECRSWRKGVKGGG